MYHRFSSRHRRRIPEFLKKHRNIADSSSTHHRPITKAPLIFTDASPKHLWISVKNVEVSPTIINSSLAYHQLITNLSLTHHRFSLTHRWRIPEFLKKSRRITDPSSTYHRSVINSLLTYHWRIIDFHRRIPEKTSTHRWPIINSSPTYQWRTIDFHRSIDNVSLNPLMFCVPFCVPKFCVSELAENHFLD